ncbi:ATP-binding protein [Bradyrhizobium liaoningense]|uniref:ATP-binding protein n=1 Tax=Bradyrhizobium liaoningense TaxID=43992 RepID=UPI001BA88A9A|nr:ATP-binding protein [Bradyrhizobium liaoningense]MBR0855516.1 ATP-binding protein [Bradyrhizobium liaoningense]
MSKTKFKLGAVTIDAQAYGSQGNAILGIRDSGKTYTATEIAELLFEAGIPWISFDVTGVWRFLRVPGAGRGYPIVVAGGKGADLPLTVTGSIEIVRAAMKNGVSLVLDLSDPNLSKADWKRIVKSCVRTLLTENVTHGLRHIFIEEAAEFVPQKVLDGDVYAEVEKLARIGGNSRLGYTLVNQRSQEVNKAVLELCENLFLHRQKGKNAVQSLEHWFDIAGVENQREIIASLPGLPSGQCWAWMGGLQPVLVKVPPKNSFHPDRRALHGDAGGRTRKPIDVGSFIAGMKNALVKVEEEDAKTNPVKLQARIIELERDLRKVQSAPAADPAAIAAAEVRGYKRGLGETEAAYGAFTKILAVIQAPIERAIADTEKRHGIVIEQLQKSGQQAGKQAPVDAPKRELAASPGNARKSSSAPAGGDGTPSLGAERKPLAALAAVHPAGMTEAQWAVAAGLKRKGGTWSTYLSRLRTAGRIERRGEEYFATDYGLYALGDAIPTLPPPGPELVAFWKSKLTGVGPMLDVLAGHYPNAITRDDLATELGLAAAGGTFSTYVSRLRSPGLVQVNGRQIRLAPALMGDAS